MSRAGYDDAGKRLCGESEIPIKETFESGGSDECEYNDGGTLNQHLIPRGARYYVDPMDGTINCLECAGLVVVK